MNFKNLLNLLSFSALTSLALANECDKITEQFSGTDTMVRECEYNDDGYATIV